MDTVWNAAAARGSLPFVVAPGNSRPRRAWCPRHGGRGSVSSAPEPCVPFGKTIGIDSDQPPPHPWEATLKPDGRGRERSHAFTCLFLRQDEEQMQFDGVSQLKWE